MNRRRSYHLAPSDEIDTGLSSEERQCQLQMDYNENNIDTIRQRITNGYENHDDAITSRSQQQYEGNNNSNSNSNSNAIITIYFFLLGLFNNVGYVIMIACAKSISEGGVGLVFVANVVPALVIKASAPFWFDKTSYDVRLQLSTLCMITSFVLVAMFSGTNNNNDNNNSMGWQLLGVAFASAQGGLGEASLLAFSGKMDSIIVNSSSSGSSSSNNNTDDDAVSVAAAAADDETHDESNKKQQNGICLTAFSSGTGAAGVFGFFWIWFWNDFVHLSLSTSLWIAIFTLPISYYSTYYQVRKIKLIMLLSQQATDSEVYRYRQFHYSDNEHEEEEEITTNNILPTTVREESCNVGGTALSGEGNNIETETYGLTTLDNKNNVGTNNNTRSNNHGATTSSIGIVDANEIGCRTTENEEMITTIPATVVANVSSTAVMEVSNMTGTQRLQLVISLWPYMVPLFVVYVAEYTLQSGTWSSIGFPVTDEESRNTFYQYSNWMYQAGVFLSRSTGVCFVVPMPILWLMPILQCINVWFYWTIASNQLLMTAADHPLRWLYTPVVLYSASFYTGLLGGAVYIHGYLRICHDLPIEHREFSLSATSLAESLGIILADIFGLVVQSCLYQINGLKGAVITCPT